MCLLVVKLVLFVPTLKMPVFVLLPLRSVPCAGVVDALQSQHALQNGKSESRHVSFQRVKVAVQQRPR
jgi:hypothetical protein